MVLLPATDVADASMSCRVLRGSIQIMGHNNNNDGIQHRGGAGARTLNFRAGSSLGASDGY